MYNEMVGISNQITSQLHNTVSGIIGQRLHSINIGNVKSNMNIMKKAPEYSIREKNIPLTKFDEKGNINSDNLESFFFEGVKKKAVFDPRLNSAIESLNYKAMAVQSENLNFSNTTKSIVFKNCDVDDYSLHRFDDIFTKYAAKLDYLELSNCNVQSAEHLFNTIGSCHFIFKNGAHIIHLNLSNNKIDDKTFKYICDRLYHSGGFGAPMLKTLDVSGNLLTKYGEETAAHRVNHTPNESLAIITEKHSNASGVWNFLKKGFKYYTESLAVKTKGNNEAAVAIYGQDDWGYCKKIMADFNRDVSVGFVKHTNDVLVKQLMQKAPDKVKKATVGAVFVVASVEAGLGVDVKNLAYCIAAISKKAGSMLDSLTGTNNNTYFSPELIGSDGQTEDF